VCPDVGSALCVRRSELCVLRRSFEFCVSRGRFGLLIFCVVGVGRFRSRVRCCESRGRFMDFEFCVSGGWFRVILFVPLCFSLATV